MNSVFNQHRRMCELMRIACFFVLTTLSHALVKKKDGGIDTLKNQQEMNVRLVLRQFKEVHVLVNVHNNDVQYPGVHVQVSTWEARRPLEVLPRG